MVPPYYLCIDTASPTVTVAIGTGVHDTLVSEVPQRRTSELLLTEIEKLLRARQLEARQLAGIVTVSGPGSFTGIRIGLATTLGLARALAVPATAESALELLARAATSRVAGENDFLSVVRIRRDLWVGQRFQRQGDRLRALAEPEALTEEELLSRTAELISCHGPDALVERTPESQRTLFTPGLAATALAWASGAPPRPALEWNPRSLVHPLYLVEPSVGQKAEADAPSGA